MQMVPSQGAQSRRGGHGNGGKANMTRGYDEDYRPYEDREYHYDNYNLSNSRTHFSRPREPLPDTDFFDGPLMIMDLIPELGMYVDAIRRLKTWPFDPDGH